MFPEFDYLGVGGNGAPLVQLLWRLPNSLALGIQSAISGAAWAFATLAALAVIQTRLGAKAWLLTATLMFWSPHVVIADASVLTESLAISGSLAALTAAICLASERATRVVPIRVLVAVMAAGFSVAILSRPVTLVFLAPCVITAWLLTWRKTNWDFRAASGLLIFTAAAYGSLLGISAAGSPSEVFRAENRLAFRASPEWIDAAERTGFSDCPELTSADLIAAAERAHVWVSIGPLSFRRLAKDYDPRLAVRNTDCSGIVDWVSDGHLTYVEQLKYAPAATFHGYFTDGLRLWFERSFTPERVPVEFQKLGPVVASTFCSASLMLLAYNSLKSWRMRGEGLTAKSSRVWVVASMGFLGFLVYSLVIWLSDPIELGRHFLPIPVVLAPFVFLVTILAGARVREQAGGRSSADQIVQ